MLNNFFKRAISISVACVSSLSSCYCVNAYTSEELKDLAAKMLCNNYVYFPSQRVNSRVVRMINDSCTIGEDKWLLYRGTLECLNLFEKKYGYIFTDENFREYYKEIRRTWNHVNDIIYRCRKYDQDVPTHYFWQAYFFDYPSKLDNILNNMSMETLRADDNKLDLLQNLAIGVIDDDSWVNDFDKDFFKSLMETCAMSEWVFFLCERYDKELMDAFERENIDYKYMEKFLKDNYANVEWSKIFFSVLEILKFQYEYFINNQ